MSDVKVKIKKRHFVTLTGIVSMQTNPSTIYYCTGFTIVVSSYPLQQRFNMATTKLAVGTNTCESCSGALAQLHLASVESLVEHSELVQVDLLCPQESDTPETSCGPHGKNRVALNPAIVEVMQSGRLGLSISA